MSTASAPAAAALDVEIVSTRDGFLALEGDWNALFDRAGRGSQVFQTFGFLRHWADGYLDGTISLAIVTGRRDGRLVMVWPLVVAQTAGLRVLSWMGEPVAQYGDVLIEAGAHMEADLAAGLAAIRDLRPDVMNLRKTRADAALAPLLAGLAPLVTQRMLAPCLDLTRYADATAFDERSTAKARRNRRRHLRRLEEMGAVEFATLEPGEAAVAATRAALAMKRAWLAARGIVGSALDDERFTRFFTDAARDAATRVLELRCNGETVAVEIAFACKSHLAVHVIAHDGEFEKFGVGALLLDYATRSAFSDGLGVFDLLAPGDAYKADWSNHSVEVMDVAVPLTLAGRLYARGWLGALRPALKRAALRGGTLLRRARTVREAA